MNAVDIYMLPARWADALAGLLHGAHRNCAMSEIVPGWAGRSPAEVHHTKRLRRRPFDAPEGHDPWPACISPAPRLTAPRARRQVSQLRAEDSTVSCTLRPTRPKGPGGHTPSCALGTSGACLDRPPRLRIPLVKHSRRQLGETLSYDRV